MNDIEARAEITRLLMAIEDAMRGLAQPLRETDTATSKRIILDYGLNYIDRLRVINAEFTTAPPAGALTFTACNGMPCTNPSHNHVQPASVPAGEDVREAARQIVETIGRMPQDRRAELTDAIASLVTSQSAEAVRGERDRIKGLVTNAPVTKFADGIDTEELLAAIDEETKP